MIDTRFFTVEHLAGMITAHATPDVKIRKTTDVTSTGRDDLLRHRVVIIISIRGPACCGRRCCGRLARWSRGFAGGEPANLCEPHTNIMIRRHHDPEVDAIVNAANRDADGGSADGAIHRAGRRYEAAASGSISASGNPLDKAVSRRSIYPSSRFIRLVRSGEVAHREAELLASCCRTAWRWRASTRRDRLRHQLRTDIRSRKRPRSRCVKQRLRPSRSHSPRRAGIERARRADDMPHNQAATRWADASDRSGADGGAAYACAVPPCAKRRTR